MNRQTLKPYMMLAPVLALIIGVFFAGLASALMQSLGYFPVVGLSDITLDYFKAVLADPQFLSALWYSLYTAFCSSLLAIALGILLAYCLLRAKTNSAVESLLAQLPIIVPHTIAAFLVIAMLGQSGLVARIAYQLGIIDSMNQFPELVFERTGWGVMIAYLWKEIPFVAVVVYGTLKSIDQKYISVARNLGANHWQSFVHITLPILAPTLLTLFSIIFAFSFGAFEVPYLLGATSPKALPVLAYLAYNQPDFSQRPYAMAINMVMALISLAIVWLYALGYRWLKVINRASDSPL